MALSIHDAGDLEDVGRLHGELSKVDLRRHHAFLQAGLEEDDLTEVKDNLVTLAENYETS